MDDTEDTSTFAYILDRVLGVVFTLSPFILLFLLYTYKHVYKSHPTIYNISIVVTGMVFVLLLPWYLFLIAVSPQIRAGNVIA